MTKHLQQVKEFHKKFGVQVRERPCIPSKEEAILRMHLLLEEALEFVTACGYYATVVCNNNGEHIIELNKRTIMGPDLELIADALADSQYVLDGAVITFGLTNCMEQLSDEVHRSNMSKLWEDGTVHRTGYGKIEKPPTYSPVVLRPILEAAVQYNANNDKTETTGVYDTELTSG